MHVIEVRALANGWRVSMPPIANDMVFHGGRAAERAARRLAYRLAKAGENSEIRLHLRDGTLAARLVSPALAAEPAAAAAAA